MKRKVKTPRYKIDQLVGSRIIKAIDISYHTTARFIYGYILETEKNPGSLMFCDENTMRRYEDKVGA